MPPPADYSLSKVEIERLSVDAYQGSSEAAYKILQHYAFAKKNPHKTKRWARIGAENGSPGSQEMMYRLLSFSADMNDQRRALYWLKRAAEAGDENAVSTYYYCDTLDAAYPNPAETPCFGPESFDYRPWKQ